MMKRVRCSAVAILTVVFGLNTAAQVPVIDGWNAPVLKRAASPEIDAAIIKQIVVTGDASGWAATDVAIFETTDNGETWRDLNVVRSDHESVAAIASDEGRLIYAVGDATRARLVVYSPSPSGFAAAEVDLTDAHRQDARFDRVSFETPTRIRVSLVSSSNFTRSAIYEKSANGWTMTNESMAPNSEADRSGSSDGAGIVEESSFGGNRWVLTSKGECAGFKSGCRQRTTVLNGTRNITPGPIVAAADLAAARSKLEAENSVFALPPGGNTRISLNRGFDKCTAGTISQMQAWWDNSYFFDANIYMSGRNRACSQPQLTAAWVDAVTNQGWGLIPTIVGYQSPCSVSTTSVKHSSDPATAEQQGRGEADIAVTDAINLGITAGSVLYYDMERYDDVSGTGACSTPTKSFLKGWTDRVKELGFKSGVYGSPTNAVADWLSIPEASRMDAVWLARWDNVMSVWTYNSPSPAVPESAWGNHQRIKQWQAPHNETWGGVTFNIDGNIADGPVVSKLIAKNRRADYDGDGKSDISVWRPSTGVWYVANSATPTYFIQTFGIATDIVTPGDFDGDGKTDLAVWRPDSGVWHIYSRSIYTAVQFGSLGDIPAAADYDGDGRTDIAVYRPSTGVWYIKNSFDSRGTSYSIFQFGLSEDKPVPDDFDGDGKADVAVWRPSAGVWHVLQSTNGYTSVQFGQTGDKPVQADFDGDGKSDFGIYRNGTWYLSQSQAGVTAVQFGLAEDIPSTGDFDGDGKYDVAVFRPSTGVWYLNQSQAGFSATQFGVAGDRPVESGYVPQN